MVKMKFFTELYFLSIKKHIYKKKKKIDPKYKKVTQKMSVLRYVDHSVYV